MSESYSAASNLSAIGVVDVMRGVARHKLLILSVGLFSFAISAGLINMIVPTYSTQSQVLIENMETPFDRVQANDRQPAAAAGVDDRVVASQMAVLKSADLGRRVVASLKLNERPDFNPLLRGIGMLTRLKIKFGFSDDPTLKSPEQLALQKYNDQLVVFEEPLSNVINIKYSAADPKVAANVANTLAEMYVMATRENQSKPTERARQWLAQQIAELRTKLADSERAAEEFRSQAGLLQSANTTLNTQQISDLNSQITLAQTASAEAKARADSIRELLASKGSVDSSSEILNSAVIQRLKEQRTAAAQQFAQLNAVYLPSHPKLIAARRALTDIDAQMKAEALKIVAGIDEQARIAASREASLRASMEKLKSRESTGNLDDVKLKALERDAAANRSLLETMLARYAEASSRQDAASQPGMARIIQTAEVPPAPSFPRRGPMVLLASIAGLVLGFGITFMVELMRAASNLTRRMEAVAERTMANATAAAPYPVASVPPPPLTPVQAAPVPADKFANLAVQPPAVAAKPVVTFAPQVIANPSPVRSAPAGGARLAPPLATLPASSGSDRSAILEQPEYAAESAKLADWAAECQRDLGARRIGFATMGGGAGDSGLAAVSVGRSLATGGKRIVIVDAAHKTSAVDALCGVTAGPGLVDLLSGAADFTKVFGRDNRSTAHVLRYGSDRSEAAFAMVLARIDQVITALSALYELVIIDCGDARDSGVELLCRCEATVLLAPVFHLAEAAEAAQALDAHGLKTARYALVA